MPKNDPNYTLKQKLNNTLSGLKENIPIIIGVLLLVSMVKYTPFFSYLQNLKNNVFSVFIADVIGSISAWNPINSRIIASQIGDLQDKVVVITTFLIARVTVWFLQIPAEIYFFGKRFAILRNFISFIFAVLAGVMVYLILQCF